MGIKRDGEEIREHPFFASLDWDEIMKGKGKVPVPEKVSLPDKPLTVIITEENTRKD